MPWGQKAFTAYLGDDQTTWTQYDATALIKKGYHSETPILIDQGGADDFLEEQLKPNVFRRACEQAGQALDLNIREGYDHSYFFIASFIEDHMRFHREHLVD